MPAMTREQQIVDEFQRNRKRANRNAQIAFLIAVIVIGGGEALHVEQAVVAAVVIIGALAWWVIGRMSGAVSLQCPVCGADMTTRNDSPLNPAFCYSCGARLK